MNWGQKCRAIMNGAAGSEGYRGAPGAIQRALAPASAEREPRAYKLFFSE